MKRPSQTPMIVTLTPGAGMTRNQKILAFVANLGTYDEAAAQFNVTRGVVAGVCHRAGLKVGMRYTDRLRENGRRQMDSLRARANRDPVLRAKWISAIKDGKQRARQHVHTPPMVMQHVTAQTSGICEDRLNSIQANPLVKDCGGRVRG